MYLDVYDNDYFEDILDKMHPRLEFYLIDASQAFDLKLRIVSPSGNLLDKLEITSAFCSLEIIDKWEKEPEEFKKANPRINTINNDFFMFHLIKLYETCYKYKYISS